MKAYIECIGYALNKSVVETVNKKCLKCRAITGSKYVGPFSAIHVY